MTGKFTGGTCKAGTCTEGADTETSTGGTADGCPDAGVVGSAMDERLPHPDQNSFSDLLGRVRPVEAEGSADPTHRSTSQLRHHADRQGLAAGNIYSGPGLVQNLTEIRPAAKETAGVPEELRRAGWASGGGRWRKDFQD